MAAALLRRRLAGAESTMSPDGTLETVGIGSAGLLPGGESPPREVVAVMAERGIDLSPHRSRQVTPQLLAVADMVVCMARRHAREVVLMDPAAWPHTFTLKELVRRSGAVEGRRPGETGEAWLARVHGGRQRADLVGQSPEDDVADPLGSPADAFRATAVELAGLVDRVAGQLWVAPAARPRPA